MPDRRLEAPQATSPQRANPLLRLLSLRRVEVVTQAVVLLLAVAWLRIPLHVVPMMLVIVLLAAANLATQWRMNRGGPVSDREMLGQLSVDVGALALLLYFAGGPANPFVSLFLLPPTLASAMLPARHAWAMAAITLVAYTFLIFWSLPLPPPQVDLSRFDALLARATAGAGGHTGHGSSFALHVLGMWLNFVVSVGIVVVFLTRMAAALKQRERELAAAREAVLRQEQILSLGTLAAGAAHQLGTPLATMAVVIREVELNHPQDGELLEDLSLLRRQVDRCKQTISQILASAGHAREEDLAEMRLDAYLQRMLDDWQLIRPQVRLEAALTGSQPVPMVSPDRTLEQAILNLLDNAADAHGENPEALRFSATWEAGACRIDILDRGPGLPTGGARVPGQPFFSTKSASGEGPGGLGIGLFLSNATVERFGGRVELFSRSDAHGGTCTRITLPLNRLER